jgi:hypothetical protein
MVEPFHGLQQIYCWWCCGRFHFDGVMTLSAHLESVAFAILHHERVNCFLSRNDVDGTSSWIDSETLEAQALLHGLLAFQPVPPQTKQLVASQQLMSPTQIHKKMCISKQPAD